MWNTSDLDYEDAIYIAGTVNDLKYMKETEGEVGIKYPCTRYSPFSLIIKLSSVVHHCNAENWPPSYMKNGNG